ncbi:MAG: hypothetical protein Q4C83_03195 [Candidatus Saccharibacteria bacterium]|nr:hypothetical protein [Candidatus Saccharibacteria bacterium]
MTNQLIARLQNDFPDFAFVYDERPHWSAPTKTIHYSDDDMQTLHELGHALLGHSNYGQDVELLQIERAAWDKARELAPSYGLGIDEEVIEEALDTYREWLHARSKCPRCSQTGVQGVNSSKYLCPTCHAVWRPSAAKAGILRRYIC